MLASVCRLLLAAFILHPSSFILSAEPPAPTHDAGVPPDAMGRSVRDVLNRREFIWRNPRPPASPDAKDQSPSALERFLKNISRTVNEWMETLRRWFHRDRPEDAPEPPRDTNGAAVIGASLQIIIYALLALLVAAVVVLLVRGWQASRAARALAGKTASAAAVALPDLADESVLADQLPEDEWLALGRRLLALGEHRLALRAFYLSALSNLGAHGLLGIARHKSNRDYQRELRRRARDQAGLEDLFGRLVARFERVWYGFHPADDALLTAFQDDRARLAASLPSPAAGQNAPLAADTVPLPA